MRYLKEWLSMKLFYFLVAFLCASSVFAQQRMITGNVIDSNGESIIGATVKVKGSSAGTITDMTGRFSIELPANSDVIVVSYIGYLTQEVKVGNRNSFIITLREDVKTLDEVVVVGYGTQKKGNVLASISTIDSDDLSRKTSSTTAAALVGKIAGVTSRQTSGTPGASAKLQIRNLGTPLYVIDGIVKDEGSFNQLDVNDIDNISILKDGAAAIYGVKAANGVVLVTTKRGQKGKPSIGFNYYHGWQSWTRFPEMSNAAEYVRADYERKINVGEPIDIEAAKSELEKWESSYYNPETGEDYRGYDWTQYARNNVPLNYYNVNASGGSDRVTYYIALSRIDQDAVFKDYNFNRNNFQANIEAKVTDNLKVGMVTNGRIENTNNPGLTGSDDYWLARFGMFKALPTYRPFANDNPQYPALLPNNVDGNLATMNKNISGFYENKWRVFQGNWDIVWNTPLKGLDAKFVFSYFYADQNMTNFERAYDLYGYDYEKKVYYVAGRKADSWRVEKNLGREDFNYQFVLNYDNTFGDHHVGGVFAFEANKRQENSTEVDQNPVDNNFLPVVSDNNEIVKNIFYNYFENATAGYALRLNYDYKGKYLIEFSGRYDGSYKFPKENRWGFFPSVSAGWRVSEEKFFKESSVGKWFTNLKLRASWGQMGDDNISGYGDFDYLGGYTFNQGYAIIATNPSQSIDGSTVIGSASRKTPMTNISWIKSEMLNIGLDLGFLGNKLTAEFDYFRRTRRGLLANSTLIVPTESALTVPKENLDSDMHTGMDGFIKWNDSLNKDFHYYVGVNFTLARLKNGTIHNELFNNSWDRYRNGRSNRWANANGMWGYQIVGRFQSQEEIDNHPIIQDDKGNRTIYPGDFIYADLNGDGLINGYDERPIGYGSDLPYLNFGINLGFQWKGIDFAADFAGATMQTLLQDYESKMPFWGGTNNSPKYMLNDRWHHEDIFDPSSPWVPGNRPALRTEWNQGSAYIRHSEYFIMNINYIRLKNIELGYTFPKAWTNKLHMQKLRVYASGTNLFSIDNMKDRGLDPEQAEQNGLAYPLHRVYTIGVNIQF